MGVEVFWRDSTGRELDRALDLSGHFARALAAAHTQDGAGQTLLRTIDPYGDTLIIPPQTETLIRELQVARDNDDDMEARVHLAKIISLARNAATIAGSYLECVGD